MRVSSSGTQSLQFLQAQQAFAGRSKAASHESGKISASENEEILLRTSQQAADDVARREALLEDMAMPTPSQWSDMAESTIEGVQALANDLGYVGLSRKAIERAMVMGESLLADYRA